MFNIRSSQNNYHRIDQDNQKNSLNKITRKYTLPKGKQ